jgi:hypothetical protein
MTNKCRILEVASGRTCAFVDFDELGKRAKGGWGVDGGKAKGRWIQALNNMVSELVFFPT